VGNVTVVVGVSGFYLSLCLWGRDALCKAKELPDRSCGASVEIPACNCTKLVGDYAQAWVVGNGPDILGDGLAIGMFANETASF
jgi:hypothetical protein